MTIDIAFASLSERISTRIQAWNQNQFSSQLTSSEIEIEQEYLQFIKGQVRQIAELTKHQMTIITALNDVAQQNRESKHFISQWKAEIATNSSLITEGTNNNLSLEQELHRSIAEHEQSLSQLESESKQRANRKSHLTTERDRLKSQMQAIVAKNAELVKAEKEKNESKLTGLRNLNDSTRVQQSALHQKLKQLEEESVQLKEKKRKLIASLPSCE